MLLVSQFTQSNEQNLTSDIVTTNNIANDVLSPSNIDICKISKKDPKKNSSHIFYGFKISRKIGKSHERNLLKRRLKNIYHEFFRTKNIDLSIIFVPKKGIKEVPFDLLKEDINKSLSYCLRKFHS